jgi:glycosyltransferase involved in cell wall biosynthesis
MGREAAFKMRVLYISNYRDQTGWAQAGLSYIQALDVAGVDVTCRPIKLNEIHGEIPARVAELEAKPHDTYDAVIQHVLPHQMEYERKLGRNVALFFAETSHFRMTDWPEKLNCMDETWVCCEHNAVAARDSGVVIPIKIIPIPCDVSRYARSYEPLSIVKKLAGNFIFYTIGESVRRKNLVALLKAFHLEFDVNEPVNLLIKTTPKGLKDEQQTYSETVTFCNHIKEGLKIYEKLEHYKKEIVIAGRYSDDEIMRLHASCDCGVFPSYGEAWSVPAFDAMGLGKTPIVTDSSGFRQYLNDDCGWMVPAHREPVYATQLDTFQNLHTSFEEWDSIEVPQLRAAMREAYENADLRKEKATAGIARAYDFSFAKIGAMMKEVLEDE